MRKKITKYSRTVKFVTVILSVVIIAFNITIAMGETNTEDTDLTLSGLKAMVFGPGEGGDSCPAICSVDWSYCGLYQCDMQGPAYTVCANSNNSATCDSRTYSQDPTCSHSCGTFSCDAYSGSFTCSCSVGLCYC